LRCWQGHDFRLPSRVLHAPEGVVGKGNNVKMLIDYALEREAHLLMVDGDLGSYDPASVGAFAAPTALDRGGLILPLWCRPRGEGNSTDFLVTPMIFAMFGARVRHPLAGQRLMTRRMLESIAVHGLPDDYGVDVSLTWHALSANLSVEQVPVPFPQHRPGANSTQIMAEVATTVLDLIRARGAVLRRDVTWPDGWWHEVGRRPPQPRSLLDDAGYGSLPPDPDWADMIAGTPDNALDIWNVHLARAVGDVRSGVSTHQIVSNLIHPFVMHAEYRRLLRLELEESEEYVDTLSRRLAAAVR
jgi:hypothetical protein